MYYWTEETRKIADEIGRYIIDGKVSDDAPEGTKEKYEHMKKLLNDEKKKLIDLL